MKKVCKKFKFPLKKVLSFILNNKKENINSNPDVSLELTENHCLNKNVPIIDARSTTNFARINKKHSRRRRGSVKMKRSNKMQIPNICIKNKKDMDKLNNSRYTNQNKRDISIIPTSIKYLLLFHFGKLHLTS